MPPTDPQRTRNRDSKGRFLAGNDAARDRGAKQAIAKTLGVETTDPVAIEVANAAHMTAAAVLRELPSDAVMVRALVYQHSREVALYGLFQAEASRVGLTSEAGQKCLERAMKHGQRAERLLISAVDVATRLAKREPTAVDPTDRFMPHT